MLASKHLSRHASNSYISLRSLSVVGWGENKSGQISPQKGIFVTEPLSIEQFEGTNVTSISAAKHHSAAVVDGVAWTWGTGKLGELGRGLNNEQCRPQRVESFIGQAEIAQVALGNQHSLFLDTQGIVYSCGDNKQGQCGSGVALEDLAKQQHQEWEQLANADTKRPMSASYPSGHRAGPSRGNPQTRLLESPMQQRMQSLSRRGPSLMSSQDTRLQDVRESSKLWEEGSSEQKRRSESFWQGAASMMNTIREWKNYPSRLGSELHNVLQDPAAADIGRVKRIAASKYFSAMAMENGGIYTCGGGYCGELGSHRSWDTRAKSVEGEIKQALEREGGAVEIAAGGTFCLALTQNGSVLSWGSLPGLPETRQRGRLRVHKMEGLPPIKHIAAGWSHALMSDGSRVWTMGRWLRMNGDIRHGGQWGAPEKILELEGVKMIAAGSHTSAVISDEGQLYLWGKMLQTDEVMTLIKRMYGSTWEGIGSDEPVHVPGLHKVQSIALGSQHAVAVIDY